MIARDLARQLRRSPPLDDPRALCGALDLGTDPHDRQRQAAGLTVRCPRHGGVSCSVTRGPDGTVRVRCFGCDFTGDALDLVAEVRGIARNRFREVLLEAAGLAGHSLSALDPCAARREPSPAKAPAVSGETYDSIARTLVDFCSPLTDIAPEVASYLDARGVFADAEAAGLRGLPRDGRELVATLLATFERVDFECAGLLRRGRDEIDWSPYALLIPWRDLLRADHVCSAPTARRPRRPEVPDAPSSGAASALRCRPARKSTRVSRARG